MVNLNFLDFLTDSPNTFIFQKEKNKTNFGGVLFLIYIIIMALISLTYIYDWAINDKYIVDALTHINTTYVEKDTGLDNDDDFNPYVDFNITITGYNDFDVDGQFVLLVDKSDEIKTEDYNINHNSIFNLHKMRVAELFFIVAFDCGEDPTCSTYDEEFEPDSVYGVIINYTGYKLSHTDDIPLEITEDIPKTFSFDIGFLDTIYENLFLNWEVIIYQDQKSLFDSLTKRKRQYIYGEIKDSKTVIDPGASKKDTIFFDPTTRKYYMHLVAVFLLNEHKEYIEYKRIKLQLLDVIANIGALFSTLKFVFSSIFSFYSQNFSNYKMVDMILKYPHPQEIKDSDDKLNKEFIPDKKEIISKVDDFPLLNDSSDENKLSINEPYDNSNKAIDENNSDESPPFVLKKLSFFDFYFNNVYLKCCKNIKNQEILNLTNEIVLQYLSLDYILYNQIKLENLFRDYKWNNPQLNSIQNNNLIMKLKNISIDE
jgi:hypothetical protein